MSRSARVIIDHQPMNNNITKHIKGGFPDEILILSKLIQYRAQYLHNS